MIGSSPEAMEDKRYDWDPSEHNTGNGLMEMNFQKDIEEEETKVTFPSNSGLQGPPQQQKDNLFKDGGLANAAASESSKRP